MSWNLLKREKIDPIHICPGDKVQFTVDVAEEGLLGRGRRSRRFVHTHDCTKEEVLDESAVFALDDELGFESGYALIAGKGKA